VLSIRLQLNRFTLVTISKQCAGVGVVLVLNALITVGRTKFDPLARWIIPKHFKKLY